MENALVFDNGSQTSRAGVAGDDSPKHVAKNGVGRSMSEVRGLGEYQEAYVGNKAQEMRSTLNITYPIQNGIITNWDDMELIWKNCYQELQVKSEEYAALCMLPPRSPLAIKEKMTQMFFENFNSPAFHITNTGLMSLYSSGRTTGLVVDVGEGVTHVTPVYEGCVFVNAVERVNFGGGDVRKELTKLLAERGFHAIGSSEEVEVMDEMSRRLGYVALNYDEELSNYATNYESEKPFSLPDGNVITVGDQMFRAPEILFNPILAGKQIDGVQQLVQTSVASSAIDARRDLLSNIVLVGGCSLFPGFTERLSKEITYQAPVSCRVKVIATPERLFAPWIGGSILASLSTFGSFWITRNHYNEAGPSIVHRMCKYF